MHARGGLALNTELRSYAALGPPGPLDEAGGIIPALSIIFSRPPSIFKRSPIVLASLHNSGRENRSSRKSRRQFDR